MPDESHMTPPAPVKSASDALIKNAHALSDAGSYVEALALVAAALGRTPENGELSFARASILFDWGRIREACAGFLQAESAGVVRLALYLNIAWSYQMLGQPDRAEPYARKAIDLEPGDIAANFGLGTILQQQKRLAEALACFDYVLKLDPEHVEAIAGIGRCMLEQKAYSDAESWFRRAIVLSPENALLHINLGAALINQMNYDESLAALKDAADLEKMRDALPLSMIDTGFSLVSTGQYEKALDVFRSGLPQVPDPRAQGYYAFLLLALGRYREGWAQYEFRWLQEPAVSTRAKFDKPEWRGQDLKGKTILLIDEQGAGDIINFCRYAVLLKALGAHVTLQIRPELARLAQGFAGVDQVVTRQEAIPPFDFYIHLMSLPNAFGTEVATIPADVPYLLPEVAKVEEWAPRFSDVGFKVGVAWAGNPLYPRDNFRSVPFATLNPLWDVPGVSFYSLQKPLKDGELEKFPMQTTLVNLGTELRDFSDTAAVIAHLDLVICVDTAIAHLAGAMGKPVWLLLPQVGDFRWLEGRDDSPWYPSIRIFRQHVLGEWDEVIARVHEALSVGGINVAKAQTERSEMHYVDESPPANIARVAHTRYGILQYIPSGEPEARAIEWYGEYMQPYQDCLARIIRPGARIVEVASGVGVQTILLSKLAGPDGHVWAYEDMPVLQSILRQNLKAIGALGCVTVMRRPLGGGEAPTQEVGKSPIETRDTLDGLLLERLDLLSIRSQDRAIEILAGSSDTLWRLRPLVSITLLEPAAADSLATRVAGFGYRCWLVSTPNFNPQNFNCRDNDIFASTAVHTLFGIPEEREGVSLGDSSVEIAGIASPQASLGKGTSQHADGAGRGKQRGLGGLLRKLLS